jgi:acetamidase/formamidase
VLRIASGDIIDVDTLLTNNPTGLERAGVPPEKIQDSLKAIVAGVIGDRRGPGGHILTGPVYVEGAEAGDVLEVKVLSIDLPIDYGYNGCAGFLPENCDRAVLSRIIPIDRKTMTAEYMPGIVIPLRPFFGSMGVAPPESAGRINSGPPGVHAGNLDNKDLVAGTTLFIPVHVKGALFEAGDGHAGQGNGEVDITAMETSLDGTFEFIVRKDLHLKGPRGETPTHWIAMGLDPDLDQATINATRDAIDFLVTEKGLSREDAYALCSVAVDFNITQAVDGTKGVHAMIPKSIFK